MYTDDQGHKITKTINEKKYINWSIFVIAKDWKKLMIIQLLYKKKYIHVYIQESDKPQQTDIFGLCAHAC